MIMPHENVIPRRRFASYPSIQTFSLTQLYTQLISKQH